MRTQSIHAIAGLFIGVGVDIIINLIAAAIQQQAFANQFTPLGIGILVVLVVVGLLVGYWLGTPETPTPSTTRATGGASADMVTVTHLKALWSTIKIHGNYIRAHRIFSVRSTIDISSKE